MDPLRLFVVKLCGCYMVVSLSSCLTPHIGQASLSTLPKLLVQSLIRRANDVAGSGQPPSHSRQRHSPHSTVEKPLGTLRTWDIGRFHLSSACVSKSVMSLSVLTDCCVFSPNGGECHPRRDVWSSAAAAAAAAKQYCHTALCLQSLSISLLIHLPSSR